MWEVAHLLASDRQGHGQPERVEQPVHPGVGGDHRCVDVLHLVVEHHLHTPRRRAARGRGSLAPSSGLARQPAAASSPCPGRRHDAGAPGTDPSRRRPRRTRASGGGARRHRPIRRAHRSLPASPDRWRDRWLHREGKRSTPPVVVTSARPLSASTSPRRRRPEGGPHIVGRVVRVPDDPGGVVRGTTHMAQFELLESDHLGTASLGEPGGRGAQPTQADHCHCRTAARHGARLDLDGTVRLLDRRRRRHAAGSVAVGCPRTNGPFACLLEALPYRKDDITASYGETYTCWPVREVSQPAAWTSAAPAAPAGSPPTSTAIEGSDLHRGVQLAGRAGLVHRQGGHVRHVVLRLQLACTWRRRAPRKLARSARCTPATIVSPTMCTTRAASCGRSTSSTTSPTWCR